MHMQINAFAIPSGITIKLSGRLVRDDMQTRQRHRSNCTPTQSDTHLNPVSTQCQASIGQQVKCLSNVVALAG